MELHNRKEHKKEDETNRDNDEKCVVDEKGDESKEILGEDYEPGLAQRLFGYGVLAGGSLLLAVWLILYCVVRVIIYLVEWARFRDEKRRIESVQTYEEWVELAKELDAKLGKNEWKGVQAPKCARPRLHIHNNYYDAELITGLTRSLTRLQGSKSVLGAIHAACSHNVGGIENSELYSHSFHGTKAFVQDFYDALERSLESLKSAELGEEDGNEVLEALENAATNWGRTALFLSGGGAMAYPDLGIVRGLLERGALPRIVCGSSCGALVAALTCLRSDEEVLEILRDPKLISEKFVFNDEPWGTILRRVRTEGRLVDHERWAERLQWVTLGNTTFLEGYRKTGKILNISVTDVATRSSRLLNYIVNFNSNSNSNSKLISAYLYYFYRHLQMCVFIVPFWQVRQCPSARTRSSSCGRGQGRTS